MTDWHRIREQYEKQEDTVRNICDTFAISPSSLYTRARKENWAVRKAKGKKTTREKRLQRNQKMNSLTINRKGLIDRLYRAFDKQMVEFEAHLALEDDHGVNEKDARTLGSLARTLEKLIELREDYESADDNLEKGIDIELLREELARRLERVCPKGAIE